MLLAPDPHPNRPERTRRHKPLHSPTHPREVVVTEMATAPRRETREQRGRERARRVYTGTGVSRLPLFTGTGTCNCSLALLS